MATGCVVRQSLVSADQWIFDFDAAAPGGKGGASVLIDAAENMASISGVTKNMLAPPRSTGGLVADGLMQIGAPRPMILEGYNIREKKTRAALVLGRDGQGTRIGYLLENTAKALGGSVNRWEPIRDGTTWHLRVHITYP